MDDPRNTDNAWMETCATLFHDDTGDLTKDLNLSAGDDAQDVQLGFRNLGFYGILEFAAILERTVCWISVHLDQSANLKMYREVRIRAGRMLILDS